MSFIYKLPSEKTAGLIFRSLHILPSRNFWWPKGSRSIQYRHCRCQYTLMHLKKKPKLSGVAVYTLSTSGSHTNQLPPFLPLCEMWPGSYSGQTVTPNSSLPWTFLLRLSKESIYKVWFLVIGENLKTWLSWFATKSIPLKIRTIRKGILNLYTKQPHKRLSNIESNPGTFVKNKKSVGRNKIHSIRSQCFLALLNHQPLSPQWTLSHCLEESSHNYHPQRKLKPKLEAKRTHF